MNQLRLFVNQLEVSQINVFVFFNQTHGREDDPTGVMMPSTSHQQLLAPES
jgi:hypothetical protein